MSIEIVAEGLGEFRDYVDRLPDISQQAAMIAINQTAQRTALPLARTEIGEQVNFPDNYLKDDSRLGVTKKATRNDLEAVIGARQRPTSLARFAEPGQTTKSTRKGGVSVVVKPGRTKQFKRGFLVRLRAGKTLTEDKYNLGLAVRLSPGETLHATDGATKLSNNVYLLYGPSVDQVFRTVADDITTEVLDALADEFLRQFTRLSE
ncbi:hypothetical protein Nazgul55 [Burkholderia phage BcepNazgul]|uniref:Neck protein n=1 Tax=Burkholderia phage BcepNazgul TaxID=242861 RepID=Q6UYI6_9CAUD|nr:hypothetical protein Nazgul55 [Burkholderia phage BcepNazgul]AAQ63355.2 hypothetical protein Nazgul55 [Burkholderia phage BcepNazgul]